MKTITITLEVSGMKALKASLLWGEIMNHFMTGDYGARFSVIEIALDVEGQPEGSS